MRHVTGPELLWHSLSPKPEIERHVKQCATCKDRFEAIGAFDAALADPATWRAPRDLLGNDSVLAVLRRRDAQLTVEVEEARVRLARLLGDPLAFIWEDVSRKPKYQTAGVVRVLCEHANAMCERDPLHALNLADCADAIASSFDESHFLGKNVFQLRGLALKERANALRYRGQFAGALDALDQAARAYTRAGVTPWEHAVVTYVRGVVLFKASRLEEAAECAAACGAVFASSGDSTRYVYAQMLEASIRYWRSDYAGARDTYRALLAIAENDGDELLAARLASNIANCDLQLRSPGDAEPALARALAVFVSLGLSTEASRARWSLARALLISRRFAEAIPRLRAAKAECESLGLVNDAARVTLDLVLALLETNKSLGEVQALCREVIRTFRGAGMPHESLTALRYLNEASRRGSITPAKVLYVGRFLEQLADQPALRFEAFS
jgi:tetratricopeptide (TPR) repeat protein